MKKIKIIIATIGGLLGVFLLLVMYAPFTFGHKHNELDFTEVLKEAALDEETKVTNIHLLGAHDAYSHNIGLFSKSDPGEDGLASNKVAKIFFKGGMSRVARAQKHSAAKLLSSGVRYFDVRVSYYEDSWYTKHGFISDKLELYLQETYTFLNANPSEFIIFDVQHIYTSDKTVNDFINYLVTTELDGHTFNDYVHYDSDTILLEDLKYKDVINNTRGGIIFLINDDETITNEHKKYMYERGDGEDNVISIRSKWHNKNAVDDIISDINDEATLIAHEDFQKMFRLNQAQLTPDYLKAPFKTIFSWSLLDIAKHSNITLLENDNFDQWLEAMPIFMVDFANSNYKDFAKLINEKIIAANQNLVL
ncbi:MAG: hypothetical protein WCZ47_03570 [Bacilli bacterium]